MNINDFSKILGNAIANCLDHNGLLKSSAHFNDAQKHSEELISTFFSILMQDPPKHKYWGAGESACPKEIKAGNGELHTLMCKECGEKNPKIGFCWSSIDPSVARWMGVFPLVDKICEEEGTSVTFTGPNPDFNGLPNEVVTVTKGPNWTSKDYRADTLLECLNTAIKDDKPDQSYRKYDQTFDSSTRNRHSFSNGQYDQINERSKRPGPFSMETLVDGFYWVRRLNLDRTEEFLDMGRIDVFEGNAYLSFFGISDDFRVTQDEYTFTRIPVRNIISKVDTLISYSEESLQEYQKPTPDDDDDRRPGFHNW